MKRFLSFLTSFVFFIWILPLGIFIKPSQEKEFCNGQRAICLCTKLVAKMKDKGLAKRFLSQAAPIKEEGQGFGFSHYFLLSQISSLLKSAGFSLITLQQFTYQFVFVRLLESVPKATFLS